MVELDIKNIIEEFIDYLAPRLDSYEQVIYLYILRHSRFLDKETITIGFKSARIKMAFGIGEKNKPMSEKSIYVRLRSLEEKGIIQLLGTEFKGTKIKALLPNEIPNLIPSKDLSRISSNIEDQDYFEVKENRMAILKRDGNKCFYCRRSLNQDNYVIEHVVTRGENSYRNLVAACRNCNNSKNDIEAEDFLRLLYRKGTLSEVELEERLIALNLLKQGKLKPIFIS